MMPISEAQKRATIKYMKNNYDRIELKVSKGKKADVQAHAAARDESLNGFVNRAIDETMERDSTGQSNTVNDNDVIPEEQVAALRSIISENKASGMEGERGK